MEGIARPPLPKANCKVHRITQPEHRISAHIDRTPGLKDSILNITKAEAAEILEATSEVEKDLQSTGAQ